MRRAGIVLAGDGVPLGQAHGAQGVGQDLGEQLVLGFEVPVEDPFADAEAVDDVGDRGGVVAVGGEGVGGEVHQVSPTPGTLGREATGHGA